MYYDMQSDRLYDNEYAMEGTNIEILKHWFGEDLKSAQRKFKEGKALIKNDPDAAKVAIKEAIKTLEGLVDKVHGVEDSKLSSILSYVLTISWISFKFNDGHKYQNNYRNQLLTIINTLIGHYKKTLDKI